MAEFKLDGRMKVKTLKENFNKCFGATLRVYTTPACKQFADDNATLASIRAEGASLRDVQERGDAAAEHENDG